MERRLYALFYCGIVGFCTLSLLQTEQLLSQWWLHNAAGGGSGSGFVLTREDWKRETPHPALRPKHNHSSSPSSVLDRRKAPTAGITHVIHWNGKEDLKKFMTTYFKEKNLLCGLVPTPLRLNASAALPSSSSFDSQDDHYLLNVTFGCHDLFYNSGLGSGNYLAGFYALRLAATVLGNVDVAFHCPDAPNERTDLILPWLTGYFAVNGASSQKLRTRMQRRVADVCANIDRCPIGYLFPQIQQELRRMAVSLVGIPESQHPTSSSVSAWLEEQRSHPAFSHMQVPLIDPREHAPLYPDVDLDDTILHFRCGDLMSSDHPRFGFLKFDSLAKNIALSSRSIGIVTQPFDASAQSRAWDNSGVKRQRCRIVVLDFVQYLQERFPNSRVRIHNSPNETIALTYARMVLAGQTIAGISTFGVFPALASFGTGYIRRPDQQSPTNGWLVHPPLDELLQQEKYADKQLVLMNEPNVLMVRQVKKLWEDPDGATKILAWFRNNTLSYQ